MTTKRAEEPRAENGRSQAQSQSQGQTISVRWDDSEITNSYANVCNVSSSREEVVLVFGVNKAWERTAGEVQVKLSNRVILSPFAAKRLSLLLDNVVNQYEARFGPLNFTADARAQGAPVIETEPTASRK
jgi:hypothetical protein